MTRETDVSGHRYLCSLHAWTLELDAARWSRDSRTRLSEEWRELGGWRAVELALGVLGLSIKNYHAFTFVWLLISGNETKALQNLHLFHFPPERVHGGP